VFAASMRRVFPDRQIVDINPSDGIFHTLYNIDTHYQVPGALYLETGLTYEKGESGKTPHWRGIYDDDRRVIVAICPNMVRGDSGGHDDARQYPAKFSDLGIRTGMNSLVYGMTH